MHIRARDNMKTPHSRVYVLPEVRRWNLDPGRAIRSNQESGPCPGVKRNRGPTMSNEKNDTRQFTQSNQPTDMLDVQYKSIGISAVTAAATALKGGRVKKPTEQMN